MDICNKEFYSTLLQKEINSAMCMGITLAIYKLDNG